jgi:hypothetical protein
MALSSGLFVALLPRELVVSSDVTNDALVIPLCALALLWYLLAERARFGERKSNRRVYLFGMGLTLGAAAVTKFNSLPVAVVLLSLCLMPSIKLAHRVPRQSSPSSSLSTNNLGGGSPYRVIDPRLLLDGLVAIVGFVVVSGWWFARNKRLYGQFLATNKSVPHTLSIFLHPLPWDAHLVLVTFPHGLIVTTWYAQPNLTVPSWVNFALAVIGLVCLTTGGWAIVAVQRRDTSWLPRLSGLALLGCILAGLAAVFVLLKETSIGDARLAFVGLSDLAIVLVVGSVRLVSRTNPRLVPVGVVVWPTVFLALDLYVLVHFLVPLGGL